MEQLIKKWEIESYFTQAIETCSSGMLKKISLASAFLGDPAVIILDEPLITLDEKSRNILFDEMGDASLYDLFLEFQTKRNITNHSTVFNLFQMAVELNLDLFDRYKFLSFKYEKKIQFLHSQLKFHLHLLGQEEKSKDLFHLN